MTTIRFTHYMNWEINLEEQIKHKHQLFLQKETFREEITNPPMERIAKNLFT